jgi:hypothetical protein
LSFDTFTISSGRIFLPSYRKKVLVDNPNGYLWHALYTAAVLETDTTRMPKRIEEALNAIKNRRFLAEISEVECAEMEATRARLATLRAERFGPEMKDGVRLPACGSDSGEKTVAN